MLRPLVEEERTREQRERARSVESQKTRKRLDALEKAANQFMDDFSDADMSRDPKGDLFVPAVLHAAAHGSGDGLQ